ncbi:MAG: hypothetical protein JW955_25090 [Sedimentisphaerales bacterium]|nr:hypothetical protein [Sedimentisphaerales bacterium]
MREAILWHLFDASVCLGLFYAVYWLQLRRETFHGLKRVYLLATLLASLLVPLASISVAVPSAGRHGLDRIHRLRDGIRGYVAAKNRSSAAEDTGLDIGLAAKFAGRVDATGSGQLRRIQPVDIAFALYLVGVGLLAARLAVRLVALLGQVRKHPTVMIDGQRVVDVRGKALACSFFRTILLDCERLGPGDLARVLRHENVHIRQCHTLDILLAEVVRVMFWFNPFAWLYCSALRVTHECLADAVALRADTDHQEYMTLVLIQLVDAGDVNLASAMSLRFVKERIEMMSRAPSPRRARLKVLAGLPTLALLLAVFAMHVKAPPRIVSAARRQVNTPVTDATADPLAPVLIEDAERIFQEVLREIERHDYVRRSYIYTRLVCMRAAGWDDADYETLMPVSGYGLTFAYHPDDHSEAHFRAPPGTDQRIARATGFGWEWLHLDDIEEYWQTLKGTIDSGRPVHAPHIEEVLFVGYQEAETKSARRVRPMAIPVFINEGTWWSWKQFQEWFTEFGGPIGRFTGQVDKLDDKEVAIEVMKTLVAMAYGDPRSDDPEFAEVVWGLAGIDAFANDIADLSLRERRFCSGWFGCHDSNPQWTARQLTGRYLQESSKHFDGAAARLMREAAQEYAAAHRAWVTWNEQLGDVSPRHAWRDKDHRLAGARAVRETLEHERRAVETIRDVLSLLSL